MQKKIFTGISILLFIASIALAQDTPEDSFFGKVFDAKGAISVKKLPKMMAETDVDSLRVKGTILEVCQAKGCWMTLDMGHGETMRVKFKDYGFFVPKDAAGKKVIMEGVAAKETLSVAEQKHLAEDAGKTEDEIADIDQPSEELTFIAEGVIIR